MRDFVIGEGILRVPEVIKTAPRATTHPGTSFLCNAARWNPENFAREQIRGLVRQVFFSSIARPVRQVVFCAVESQTDVGHICRQVGETLAQETQGSIVVVGREPPFLQEIETPPEERYEAARYSPTLGQIATRVRSNLWFANDNKPDDESGEPVTSTSLYSRLTELRREFEYSIVEAPPAGESSEAAALGQLADGIILVLAAHYTRRATAYRIKERLEAVQARILGTVLTDRTFPIPEGIYRRL